MRSHRFNVKGTYPEHEIQWLMLTAWNRGVDLYSIDRRQDASEWCRLAMAVRRHLSADTQRSYTAMADFHGRMFPAGDGG